MGGAIGANNTGIQAQFAGASNQQPPPPIPENHKPAKFATIPEGISMTPALNGETVHDPQTKQLALWKGQRVLYVDGEPRYQHPENFEVFVHIFFPDKPPTLETLGETQGRPEDYSPEIEELYKQAKQAGQFTTGLPKVPPKPEWCSFDL